MKVIPVAVGQEVDPDLITVAPNVIVDPVPEVAKPEKLVSKIMGQLFIGKIKCCKDNPIRINEFRKKGKNIHR